jgi:hypothetical protein
MEFKKRKIKFKAWDQEHRLLMRLNNIDCNKGELNKKSHILLQFTGLHDKEGEEIYEMDVLMISLEKYLVFWNETKNGWYYAPLLTLDKQLPFVSGELKSARRFCSYYELTE